MNVADKNTIANRLRSIFVGYWSDFFSNEEIFRVLSVLEITNLAEALLYKFAENNGIHHSTRHYRAPFIDKKIEEIIVRISVDPTQIKAGKILLNDLLDLHFDRVFPVDNNPLILEFLRETFSSYNFTKNDLLRQLNENSVWLPIAAKFSDIDDLLRDTFRNRHTHQIELSIPPKKIFDVSINYLLEFLKLIEPNYKDYLGSQRSFRIVSNHWDFFEKIINQHDQNLLKTIKTKEGPESLEIITYYKLAKKSEQKILTIRRDRDVWDIIKNIEEGTWIE